MASDRQQLIQSFNQLPELSRVAAKARAIVTDDAIAEHMLDREDAAALLDAERAVIDLARRDPVTFNAYVLRDEEHGRQIHNEPVHEDWHDFLTGGKRALIWGSVDSGKTTQIAVGRVLWELGHDPSLRIAIVSNTDGQAQKIARILARYIEGSEALHEVFPNLRRAKGQPWTAHQLFVERPTRARDASIVTCGVHGNILGARLDLVIFDDILDYENTTSEAMRHDVSAWIRSTIDGRMTRRGRIWYLGMVWDAEDHMHQLSRNPAYISMRSPVVDDDGVLTQPNRWPAERVAQARQVMHPVEFDRQVRCKTLARSEKSPFKPEWIEACRKRGEGKPLMAARVTNLGPGERVYSGVDLGVRDTKDSALSAIFTLLIHPNEDRQVLCVESGRWDGPELIDRIKDTHRRFNSIIFVENVAAQDLILQFARRDSAVPVRPFQTSGKGQQITNVNHPEWGFEAMAIEMYNGKWIIPSAGGVCHSEVEAWISDLLMWERGRHVGDRAMACWIASQGARFGQAAYAQVRKPRLAGALNR